MRTTIHIENLHCQSCVDSVIEIISGLSPAAVNEDLEKAESRLSDIDVSLADGTLTFTHPEDFDLKAALKQLDAAGFDVGLDASTHAPPPPPNAGPSRWMNLFGRPTPRSRQREAAHRQICGPCLASQGDDPASNTPNHTLRGSKSTLVGLPYRAFPSALAPASGHVPPSLLTLQSPSAVVVRDADIHSAGSIHEASDDGAYEDKLAVSKERAPSLTVDEQKREPASYKAIFSILGMTCASCVSSVTAAMESVPGTTSVSVDLLGKTGSAVVRRKADAELVRNEVDDVGFDCAVVQLVEQHASTDPDQPRERTTTVRIDGMSCGECLKKVTKTLDAFAQSHALTFTPVSLADPTTTLTYTPEPPAFTLRLIRDLLAAHGLALSVVHTDTLEERAARARAREQRRILLRLAVTFLVAIPTFVVAVVGMSLVHPASAFRRRLAAPVWGNASCATVVLFALATPVQFGVGAFFYTRAWKGLKGVWRTRKPGADWRRVWLERLFRWGSMDSLVSLGTTTGYIASLGLMVLDIRSAPEPTGGAMGWFDSSVFLILFIMGGRYLESISKQRTGDAISTLSATKPSTGLLYTPTAASTRPERVDFIEVGDVLIVPVGASPPLDAALTPASPRTTFDEASLTGEARPVLKAPGDAVFAGTTNAGPAAALVTVTRAGGETMLDGIVGVVRDAMGKKARLERIADIVTGYFVPFVVGVAGLTFGVWCLRGYLGVLPAAWVADQREGGWALFAVQFGVAVLVVACPCGIGLAAPTAQMVAVGLAAQHGILSNGGGEAFQTISAMNTVVLDKTGTLTTSKFTVSDHKILVDEAAHGLVCSILGSAEQASTHPLAVGVREWCHAQLAKDTWARVELVSSEEIPGRGLVAVLVVEGTTVEVAIGNEKLMRDMDAQYASAAAEARAAADLRAWQQGGKSVVLLSARLLAAAPAAAPARLPLGAAHAVLGLFGVHDPPRPEAAALVAELHRLRMDVWMISGDNAVTAQTVARRVGIPAARVVAEALPVDKQVCVRRLQDAPARAGARAVVAFCGDGINDAPAIAQADVGLAMGGGSNVAVSTADFCLLNSSLLALLTVHSLARATRRKILSNFVWACLYNVALMPLAAGAFYPLGRTTLPAVWGSAAMALSSVSVVMNSLVLRWMFSPPKAVRTWRHAAEV